jgi:hypothetical protein
MTATSHTVVDLSQHQSNGLRLGLGNPTPENRHPFYRSAMFHPACWESCFHALLAGTEGFALSVASFLCVAALAYAHRCASTGPSSSASTSDMPSKGRY